MTRPRLPIVWLRGRHYVTATPARFGGWFWHVQVVERSRLGPVPGRVVRRGWLPARWLAIEHAEFIASLL